jgi:hypothetical protein
MDFGTATQSYEAWLAKQMKLDREGLRRKHAAMAADEFSFMRATYYRWAQTFPKVCADISDTPTVLSVGDLHVENFGTWRDAEGRLVWGINDFDEAANLPYANDLVRLSLSARIALQPIKRAESIWADASAAILVGYSDRMRRAVADGVRKIHPIVLAETNHWLAKIAVSMVHDPKKFWERLESQLSAEPVALPRKALAAGHKLASRAVPKRTWDVAVHSRYAGLGSMGRPRYVAIGHWCGGRIAREAKALAAPAAAWAKATNTKRIMYEALLEKSVRSRDPYAVAVDGWMVRRLAPDCARILFENLPDKAEMGLFYAMGEETANIHLASPKSAQSIVADLDKRHGDWLVQPVGAMLDALNADFREWRDAYSSADAKPVAKKSAAAEKPLESSAKKLAGKLVVSEDAPAPPVAADPPIPPEEANTGAKRQRAERAPLKRRPTVRAAAKTDASPSAEAKQRPKAAGTQPESA